MQFHLSSDINWIKVTKVTPKFENRNLSVQIVLISSVYKFKKVESHKNRTLIGVYFWSLNLGLLHKGKIVPRGSPNAHNSNQ